MASPPADESPSTPAGEEAAPEDAGDVRGAGAASTPAQRRLAAALAGVELTPEATSDDLLPPMLPAIDPLVAERPPHHMPKP